VLLSFVSSGINVASSLSGKPHLSLGVFLARGQLGVRLLPQWVAISLVLGTDLMRASGFTKSSYCVGEIGKQDASVMEESRMLALQSADSHKRKADEQDDAPDAKRPARNVLQSGVKHHIMQQGDEEEMEQYRKLRAQDEDPLKGLKEGELLPL
jgi:hypothetical protein